ncbi:MAG: hypothetical protein QXK12_06130 [Candidatus Nezhaarchaeales archaeon]
MEIKAMEEVPLVKVKAILEKLASEVGELKYHQQVTLDYSSKFSKAPLEKIEELVQRLTKEKGLSKLTAIQIANILPREIDELRPLLSREGRTFLRTDLEAILDLIKEVIG